MWSVVRQSCRHPGLNLHQIYQMAVMQDLGPDDDDGQIAWKQQLCLNHVRLRSTSVAVLEVHRRMPEGTIAELGQSSAGNVEVLAWAFTKIVQVQSA